MRGRPHEREPGVTTSGSLAGIAVRFSLASTVGLIRVDLLGILKAVLKHIVYQSKIALIKTGLEDGRPGAGVDWWNDGIEVEKYVETELVLVDDTRGPCWWCVLICGHLQSVRVLVDDLLAGV